MSSRRIIKIEDILDAYDLQSTKMSEVFLELGAEVKPEDMKNFREIENKPYEDRARKFLQILESKFLGISDRNGEPLFKIDTYVEKVRDKKSRKSEDEKYTHLFISIGLENSFYYNDKLYQLFLNNLKKNFDEVEKIGIRGA